MNTLIYRLLGELEKVQLDQQATLFNFKYVTYNGFKRANKFTRYMDDLYKEYKHAVNNLPQSIPEKEGRKTFLVNLYHILLIIQEDLENFFKKKLLNLKFNFSEGINNESVEQSFSKVKYIYPDKKDFVYHQLHLMYHYHYKITLKSIEILIVFAIHDGYDLANIYEENLASPNSHHKQQATQLHKKLTIENEPSILWTGKSKTEFVQLIYALFQARLLNNGSGEITKIVEKIARVLEIELNKQWQSVHSKSIHARNNDYQIVLFKKLEMAYCEFRDDRIEKARVI